LALAVFAESDMTPLPDAMQRFTSPGHVCSIYSDRDEQLASAVPFLHIGLERGERCAFVADDQETFAPMLAKLQESGVDVDAAMRSGALLLLTTDTVYLRGGKFDPLAMLAFWKQMKGEADRLGFSGLRGAGETAWLARDPENVARWMEYEAALTDVLLETGCLALCQYDRQVCQPGLLLSVLRAHPIVISERNVCENFYFVPSDERRDPQRTEREVDWRLRNLRERDKTIRELEVFRALVDGSNNAIEIVDPDTNRILDVNGQSCRDLGYTREELLQLTIFDIDPSRKKA
jgi:two-component system, chemotaxis family, sensor kinase Cph1